MKIAKMSSSTLKAENVLLFGATGLIGSFILEAILNNRSSFNRIVVFTSPSTNDKKQATLESLKNKGVEIAVGNIKDEKDVLSAYEGNLSSLALVSLLVSSSEYYIGY